MLEFPEFFRSIWPEHYFTPCSASAILPCIDSPSFNSRTRSELQTARIGQKPRPGRVSHKGLSTGYPRNAQIRDSRKALPAK